MTMNTGTGSRTSPRVVIFWLVLACTLTLTLVRCGGKGGIQAREEVSASKVLGAAPLDIVSAAGVDSPKIVFDNISSRYLVVWSQLSSSVRSIRAQWVYVRTIGAVPSSYRFSSSPLVVERAIAFDEHLQERPLPVLLDGTGCEATVTSGSAGWTAVFLTRPFTISRYARNPSVAWGNPAPAAPSSPSRFMIAFEQYSSDDGNAAVNMIRAKTYHADPQVPVTDRYIAPAYDYGAVMANGRIPFYNISSTDFAVPLSAPGPSVVSTAQYEPSVAYDDTGDRFGIAWVDKNMVENYYRFRTPATLDLLRAPRPVSGAWGEWFSTYWGNPMAGSYANTTVRLVDSTVGADDRMVVYRFADARGEPSGNVQLQSQVDFKGAKFQPSASTSSFAVYRMQGVTYLHESTPAIAFTAAGAPVVTFKGAMKGFTYDVEYAVNGFAGVSTESGVFLRLGTIVNPFWLWVKSAEIFATPLDVFIRQNVLLGDSHDMMFMSHVTGVDSDKGVADPQPVSFDSPAVLRACWPDGFGMARTEGDGIRFYWSQVDPASGYRSIVMRGYSSARGAMKAAATAAVPVDSNLLSPSFATTSDGTVLVAFMDGNGRIKAKDPQGAELIVIAAAPRPGIERQSVAAAGGGSPLPYAVAYVETAGGSSSLRLRFVTHRELPVRIEASSSSVAVNAGMPIPFNRFSAVEGTSPFSWTLSGAPAWITTETSSSGRSMTIGGTPSSDGTWPLRLTLSDGSGGVPDTVDIGITVYPPLAFTTAVLPAATEGLPYTAPISVTGSGSTVLSIGRDATCDGDASFLPAGVVFDGTSITGTPVGAGDTDLFLCLRDSVTGASLAPQQFRLSVAEAPARVAPAPGGENGMLDRCFIATAAYGSFLDPHVASLRSFRDRYLLTNAPGRAFVRFYYRHSPPIAAYISRHDSLRFAVRCLLAPVVLCVEGGGWLFVPLGCLAWSCLSRRRTR